MALITLQSLANFHSCQRRVTKTNPFKAIMKIILFSFEHNASFIWILRSATSVKKSHNFNIKSDQHFRNWANCAVVTHTFCCYISTLASRQAVKHTHSHLTHSHAACFLVSLWCFPWWLCGRRGGQVCIRVNITTCFHRNFNHFHLI